VITWTGRGCRGPAWLDTLLLINARLHGGHDTHALLINYAVVTGAYPQDLIAVLTGLAGYFVNTARRPPPKGLPTLRAFQQAQADAILSRLRNPLQNTRKGRSVVSGGQRPPRPQLAGVGNPKPRHRAECLVHRDRRSVV
jgi:hypothetical protein